MNYVFFGTPQFAEIILEKLLREGMVPALVVCNPDRPVGRKKIITSPPTKILAEKHEIPVFQPEQLSDKNTLDRISVVGAEFAVLAAYGKIVPKETLEIFSKGIIGVHPSLLPKYRGATPIQSVILDGENQTGTTLFLMDEEIDHGPIIAQQKLEILHSETATQNITYLELHDKLAELGAEMVLESLPKYIAGNLKPTEQNHGEATFTKKIKTEDAKIEYEELLGALGGEKEKSEKINLTIKALNPEPGAFTMVPSEDETDLNDDFGFLPKGKRVKLLVSEIKNGKLILKRIQSEGERPKNI